MESINLYSCVGEDLDHADMSPIEEFECELKAGVVITAVGLYKEGTNKFTINMFSEDRQHIFHLDFRPDHNQIVMNSTTREDKDWEVAVKCDLPVLGPDELFRVDVICKEDKFKIKINDKPIDAAFSYRYELQNITLINFKHGSEGNKWVFSQRNQKFPGRNKMIGSKWDCIDNGDSIGALKLKRKGKANVPSGDSEARWKLLFSRTTLVLEIDNKIHTINWNGENGVGGQGLDLTLLELGDAEDAEGSE